MKILPPLLRLASIGLGSKVRQLQPLVRSFAVSSAAASKGERQRWGTTKKTRALRLLPWEIMADPKIEEALAPLRAAVKEQVGPALR